MKGTYGRNYGTGPFSPKPERIVGIEELRLLLDALNTKYGTRYRIEVQGAEADPGTEPPVYVLMHGDTECGRGSKVDLWDRLAQIDRQGGKP